MQKQVLLSIAIPTYNRKNELCKLLDSLRYQQDTRVEVLVCDNCSTDGTENVIKKKYPWIIYFKNVRNEGADRNFLHCYHRAKGKYVLLIGSDDIVAEDGISRILKFISGCKEEPSLIYLNNSLFVENKDGNREIVRTFLSDTGNKIIHDRDEFLKVTKCRITFMSCMVLNMSFFNKVKEPEVYYDTSFIHTCIFFEGTQNSNNFGVVSYPCILGNVTEGAAGLSKNISNYLMVFAYRMKKVLCEIGPKFGLDRKLMGNIYICEIYRTMSLEIIKSKLNGIDIKEAFWKYTFPSIAEFPVAWFTIIPAYFLPRWIIILLYRYIKPFLNGLKKQKKKER